MNPTGSNKTWITLPVICRYISSSQSSWHSGLSSSTWSGQMKGMTVSGHWTRIFLILRHRKQAVLLNKCFWRVHLPWIQTQSVRVTLLGEVWRLCSCRIGINAPVFLLHIQSIWRSCMEILLESVKYKEYQWCLYGDFKVIELLIGMQAGFTKYCCFLSPCESRAESNYYK